MTVLAWILRGQKRVFMERKSFMERLAGFIVERRYLFMIIFAALCIMSIFTSAGVKVNGI